MPNKLLRTPSLVAKVKNLAETSTVHSDNDVAIDKEVLQRIQNCLRRANHPGTPESEAQTALRMSSRLMEKYNISQADLIAAEVESERPSTRAGQSTVSVTKAKPTLKTISPAWLNRVTVSLLEKLDHSDLTFEICKTAIQTAVDLVKPSQKLIDKKWIDAVEVQVYRFHWSSAQMKSMLPRFIQQALRDSEPSEKVRGERWSDNLGHAIEIAFDCEHYTVTGTDSRDWVFYGLATNTAAAALSFEAVFNIIERWALLTTGDKASYRIGISKGLESTARQEKRDELQRAKKQEAASLKEQKRAEKEARNKQEEEAAASSNMRAQSSYKPYVEDHPESKAEAATNKNKRKYISDTDDSDSDENADGSSADHDKYGYEEESYDPFTGGLSTFDVEDEEELDLNADLEHEIHRHLPRNIPPSASSSALPSNISNLERDRAQRESDKTSGMLWRDAGVLILFRKNALKIAEDYLLAQNTKLSTERKRTARARDAEAYRQGKKDSKKIDMKRRRIKDKVSDDEATVN